MIATLTIIFAFMVFMIILNKGNFFFISGFSMLIAAAISLGVGYGMAMLVVYLMEPLLKIILIIVGVVIVGLLILVLFGKKGD